MKIAYLLLSVFVYTTVEGATCQSDSECDDLNNCINSVCIHKSLMPLAPSEWGASVCLLILAVIATAGGVGGSIVSTSLSLLLVKFDSHHATSITHAFVFAGTITTVLLKFRDRHPVINRPLIYYDLIMQVSTPLLLGVSIGVIMNPMFPDWLILALLTIVVAYLTYDITFQGIRLYHEDTKKLRLKALASNENKTLELSGRPINEPSENFEDPKNVDPEDENGKISNQEEPKNVNPEDENGKMSKEDWNEPTTQRLGEKIVPINTTIVDEKTKEESINPKILSQIQAIYETEAQVMSLVHLSYFIFLAAFSIVIALLIGSKSNRSIIDISSCSGEAYGILVTYIMIMLSLSFISTMYLLRKEKICSKGGYPFDHGDLRWTTRLCIGIILTGIFTGILVGLLGLGGGYIIGPILLHLGVRPEVSTVSSSFTICISSFTALVEFFVYGTLDYQYVLWYFGCAITGAFGGILGLRGYAIRKGRPSVLILTLSITLLAALVIIPTNGIMTAVSQYHHGNFQLSFVRSC